MASTPLPTSSIDCFVALERDREVDVGHRFGEVVPGEQRHDRRLVHELEVGEVDAVLEHVLRMHFQRLAVQPLLGVVVGDATAVGEARENVRRLEEWGASLDVMPDVDRFVALGHRVGAHAAAAVRARLIGDADVATLDVPLPAVEGALNHLADDVAAEAEVCSEVLAVGVHDRDLAGFGTPRDHLLAEVLHGVDVAQLDFVGPRDLEPSRRLHG